MTSGQTPARVPDERLRPLASPVAGVTVVELDLQPRPQDRAVALLDDADRARLAALPPAPAAAMVARRALVALVMAERWGVPVARLRWCVTRGRPGVTAPAGLRAELGLSSSGSRGLLAVSDQQVGVDLELAQPLPDASVVADALLPEPERTWVTRGGPAEQVAERFLRVWVRKEAVVKCTGEGLDGRSLSSFVVDARRPRAVVRDGTGRPLGLVTVELPLPAAYAALAVRLPSSGS